MAEETTSTSGITGNARKSQESGVRLRDTTKKMTTIPRLLTLMVMVVIFFLIITYPMSLFWKVTSGIVILIAGIKLAGVKDDTLQKEIKWKFPLVLQGMGGVIIAIAFANSGIVTWLDDTVSYLDTCAASECPRSDSDNTTSSTRSPDRVNRTRGNFRTSTLGYLPVIVVYPGQKSQEIASYSNSCLDVEYVSGSSAYQAHSRGADGRDRVGVMPKAYFVWFTLPATERESAIIQVIRKAC